MGLRIQNNIEAMNAHRQLTISNNLMSKSLERLSSGFRINRSSDDAAGLAISTVMRADIASYKVASRNTAEANSLLQVAEGAYDQISNILTRLKELTTQGSSANAAANKTDIENEVDILKTEITRIVGSTEYSGQKVLEGYGTSVSTYSAGIDTEAERDLIGLVSITGGSVTPASDYDFTATDGTLTLTDALGNSETQVVVDGKQTVNFQSLGVSVKLGAAFDTSAAAMNNQTVQFAVSGGDFVVGTKDDADHRINVSITAVSLTALSLNGVTGTAMADLDTINDAISTLASGRAEIGAGMNRLAYAAANLATTIENVQAAESVIRDVDMAAEMTQFTKTQILMQAGTAMLGQANMAPQNVLSLIGGR